jgi:ribonuclease D
VYQLVENSAQLENALEELYKQPIVAFDLEFDRDRHTYGFDLCLLQIGYDNKCLIIDPVGIEDMQPIFDFFENPTVKKLVHCPGEDMRLLHSLKCYPKNIADTEVMAKLLNYEQTSLARLLEAKCDVVLNKKQQQSNWHNRPLHADQLSYAADDVLYLLKLYDILLAEINQKGFTEMITDECEWLQTVRYTLEPKTNFLKPGDLRNMSPRDGFILNEIFLLRDKIAQKKNKPAYMIMPEESVRKLADRTLDYTNIAAIPGLHPSLRNGKTAAELQESIYQIFSIANKNGLAKSVNRGWNSEEDKYLFYERKRMQVQLKEKLFEPVQKRLSEQLGAFAARYVFSNGWITKWFAGEVKWEDMQPPYKRKLIEDIAKELELPIGDIEQYESLK